MILLFIFLIGCLVMSLVAVGLLLALASVGSGSEYLMKVSERSRVTKVPSPGIHQPEVVNSEPHV